MIADVSSFQVEVVLEDRLTSIRPQWEMLAASAVEPNLFFEPWMLLPALQVLEIGSETRFVLIWYSDPDHANAERILVGFFPFIPKRRLKKVPVRTLEILTHIYCFTGVPLLRQEFAKNAMEAFLAWLGSPASGTSCVLFSSLPNDGAFHQALIETLFSHSVLSFPEKRFTRALYRCVADPKAQIERHLSHKYLKQLRRKKDGLGREGDLAFRTLPEDDGCSDWVDAFLQLEASGWKGLAGTALASAESHAKFFRDVTLAAHQRKRLRMFGLWLDGHLIAGCTGFRAGDGLLLFKIAFDEKYSKYSPGILLQMECMSTGYDGSGWVDCCTTANNPVFPRLWMQRRTMEDLIVSAGSLRADLLLSTLPFLAFAKRRLAKLSSGLFGKSKELHEGNGGATDQSGGNA